MPLAGDAAIALGMIGLKAKLAVPHLEKLREHDNPAVRQAVANACKQIKAE